MVSVSDFGIVPDVANTTGFVALRNTLLSNREAEQVVEFAPGTYLNGMTHWLQGVGRVRLLGNRTSLQHSIGNSSLFSESEPFRTLAHDDTTPSRDPVRTFHPGIRVASVDEGRNVLTALDPIPENSSGAAALLGGFVQQTANNHLPIEQRIAFGWPPNLRWFEYVRIAGISGHLIRLSSPLKHSYDEGWRDFPGNHFGAYVAGAPRLYLCNRADWNIPNRIEFHGFTFLRSLNSTTGGHIGFKAALRLHLQDCIIDPGGFIQMNKNMSMRRCKWLGDLEIDKCIENVLIEDCQFHSNVTSDGAGCMNVIIRNSIIFGDFRINPRTNVVLENVEFHRNFSLNATHGGHFADRPSVVSTQANRK